MTWAIFFVSYGHSPTMYSTAGRFSLFSLSDIAGMTLSADVMCRSLSNQIENNNYHYPTNCHWHFVKYMWHMLSDVYISTSIYAPIIILSFMSLYVLGVLTLIIPWGLLELFLILADSQLGDNTFSYSAGIWAIPLYEKKAHWNGHSGGNLHRRISIVCRWAKN